MIVDRTRKSNTQVSGVIEIDRLKRLLHYEAATGIFTWRKVRRGGIKAGQIASTRNGNGYRRIVIDCRKYYAHRLAWFYMTSEWPKNQIDHINGARSDNRWENLREATASINQQNQRAPNSRNTTGFLGVMHNTGGKFTGLIEAGGKRYCLGTYDTPQEAHHAYVAAKRRLHHGNTM